MGAPYSDLEDPPDTVSPRPQRALAVAGPGAAPLCALSRAARLQPGEDKLIAHSSSTTPVKLLLASNTPASLWALKVSTAHLTTASAQPAYLACPQRVLVLSPGLYWRVILDCLLLFSSLHIFFSLSVSLLQRTLFFRPLRPAFSLYHCPRRH